MWVPKLFNNKLVMCKKLLTTKSVQINFLKSVYENVDPNGDGSEVPQFVDEDGILRKFSVARRASLLDLQNEGLKRSDLVIKAIHYWLPSLKYQEFIKEFIDVGWFRLLRETSNSCYWDLVKVNSMGIALDPRYD